MVYSMSSHFSELIILKRALDELIIIFKRCVLGISFTTKSKTKSYFVNNKQNKTSNITKRILQVDNIKHQNKLIYIEGETGIPDITFK